MPMSMTLQPLASRPSASAVLRDGPDNLPSRAMMTLSTPLDRASLPNACPICLVIVVVSA